MSSRLLHFICIGFCFLVLAACSSPSPTFYPETPEMAPSPPPYNNREMVKRKGNSRYLIVIDPGHGGEDFGAHSNSRPHYQEKYLNLSTAQMLRYFLNQQGYRTVMTRMDDTFISLDRRAEFANELSPTLFVSVHYNSAPSKEAEGVEVYFYRSEVDKKRSQESRLLAQCVLEGVLENTQAKSRGVKHGNFAVIRQTTMPAILIEGGFLTNDKEMAQIKNPAYLKKLAWGIAEGIHSFLEKQ